MLQVENMKKRLPHRYPFLMLDRVLELEEGKRCLAVKNVTYTEGFFQGHFPGNPIMPGVLVLEALAQTAGIAAYALETNPQDKLVFFAGIDKARFKRPVVPGDQLLLEATYVSHKMSLYVFQCRATVDGNLAVSAELRVATVLKPGLGGGDEP